MTEILGKLSMNFEKYLKVISVMKSEYFNIIPKISQGELYHLGRSIDREDIKQQVSIKYDEFLDAFSKFRDDPTDQAKKALAKKTRELKDLDDSFEFDPDIPVCSDLSDEIGTDL